MRTLTAILLALLALALSACGTTLTKVPELEQSAALITDTDLAAAKVETASETSLIKATELVAIPDGTEASVPDAQDFALAPQDVLPDVSGYVTYVHFNGLSGHNEVWRANQINDQKTFVYEGSYYIHSVASSLDGNTMVFSMANSGGCCAIYKYVVSTHQLTRLNVYGTNFLNVSITADGKTIAWDGKSANNGKRVVFVRSYSGSSYTQSVVSGAGSQSMPSISGNGTYLTFLRISGGMNRIMRLNRQANTVQQVAESSNSLSHPSPSNGSKIAWVEDRPNQTDRVQVKDVSTGAVITAVSTNSYFDHVHMTSDGRYLTWDAYTSGDGKYKVFTRNINSNQQVTLVQDAHWFDAPFWQK